MPDLGRALVDANLLTPAQLKEALAVQEGSLTATLVQKGFVKEAVLVGTVASLFGVGKANASDLQPSEEVQKLVPAEIVTRTQCLPLRKEGRALVVATADPSDEGAVSAIAQASGLSVKMLVAAPTALAGAIARAYGEAPKGGGGGGKLQIPGPSVAELDEVMRNAVQEIHGDDADAGTEDLRGLTKLAIQNLDPPIVRLVNGILLKALKIGASDIHVETLEEEMRVRLRVDGILLDVLRIPGELKNTVASRIKILAGMDIAERRVPQDGGIKVALGERDSMDFRCSSLPNIYGEKIVMRVLGTSELRGSVDELGFEGQAMEWVREAIANPYGMIIVTGPTGSGKTTTLYTILNQLNEDDVNIVTAEDPVEYRLAGITQVNVRPVAGLTFDAALRSFLRQDPDIILVGEMRDYETAAIAVKAALTGHLVLSTVHTNDAPSTVVRLVDMGVEPYLVASAVKLVIAQRLVRRICEACKQPVDLSELERTDLDEATLSSVEALFRGAGCETCNGTGYKGRVPVHEVLAVKSKEMKRAITEGGTEVQVAQIAKREGMVSLAESAIAKVNAGTTTIEEAVSIIAAE
jgi:type IV pilus assembly protein PilB